MTQTWGLACARVGIQVCGCELGRLCCNVWKLRNTDLLKLIVHWQRLLISHSSVLFGNLVVLKSLYLLSLLGGLIFESLGLVGSGLGVLHHFNSLNVLLSLELFEELLVAHQDAVRISLLLLLTGEQFRCGIPAEGLSRLHTRVEGFEASALGTLLLTELIRTVTKHHTLVVTNGRLRPVTTVTAADSLAHFCS